MFQIEGIQSHHPEIVLVLCYKSRFFNYVEINIIYNQDGRIKRKHYKWVCGNVVANNTGKDVTRRSM